MGFDTIPTLFLFACGTLFHLYFWFICCGFVPLIYENFCQKSFHMQPTKNYVAEIPTVAAFRKFNFILCVCVCQRQRTKLLISFHFGCVHFTFHLSLHIFLSLSQFNSIQCALAKSYWQRI